MRGFAGVPRRAVVPFPCFVAMVWALLCGIFVMMPVQVVRAQTAGGGNSVIAQLISKGTALKLAELGFTDAEQSTIAATYAAMSEAAAASAASSWLGLVGKIVGPLGLMAVSTDLGDDTLTAWALSHAGLVTVLSKGGAANVGGHWQFYELNVYTDPLNSDPTIANQMKLEDFASLADAAATFAKTWSDHDDYEKRTFGTCPAGQTCGPYGDIHTQFLGPCDESRVTASYQNVGCVMSSHDLDGVTPDQTGMNYFAQGMNGTPSNLQPPGAYAASLAPPPMSVDAAIAAIPAADLAKPLSPQVVADLANALWEQASEQPGYQGVPYPSTAPITSGDITTANGPDTAAGWPSVGTAVAPVTAPTGGGNPYAIPVTTGSPTGGTGPASGASGTSPSNAPGLCDEFPSIIACQTPGSASAPDLPSSSGSVSVSPVTVGASDGVCPSPVSVSVFGNDISFSYQTECDFMTRVRPFLLAMCGIIAALVFGAGLKS